MASGASNGQRKARDLAVSPRESPRDLAASTDDDESTDEEDSNVELIDRHPSAFLFGGDLRRQDTSHRARLSNWLEDRFFSEYGWRDVALMLTFMGFTGLRFEFFDHYQGKCHANVYSIFFAASIVSFLLSLVVTFVQEGQNAIRKLLSWTRLWHRAIIAFLWTLASLLWSKAYGLGPIPVDAVIASCCYLPICTWMSEKYFKDRHYSTMVWLSIAIQTLTIATFLAFRSRYSDCREGEVCGSETELAYVRSHHNYLSAVVTICSVTVSAVASILAENLFRVWEHDSFFVFMTQVQFVNILIFGLWYAVFIPNGAGISEDDLGCGSGVANSSLLPDSSWGHFEQGLVLLIVGQGWAAGLVVKYFSTVSKSVMSGIATIGFVFATDGLQGRYSFDIRGKPAFVLLSVLFLAALLFQSGRVHSNARKRHKQMLERAYGGHGDEEAEDDDNASVSSIEDGDQPCCHTPWFSEIGRNLEKRGPRQRIESSAEEDSGAGTLYTLSIVYIGAYVMVREFNSIAVSGTEINPTSLTMMSFVGGLTYSSVMTYKAHGWDGTTREESWTHSAGQGLKQALSLNKLLEFGSASFLFAASQVFINMAYSSKGANPSLISVVGTLYVPVLAIINRAMGRRILWVEWLAIIILFLATVAFGWLQSYDPEKGMVLSTTEPIVLTICSSVCAALRDLLQNKLYNKNKDADFMMNMVRFQAGGFFFTACLLPILSITASRPKDIIWLSRPVLHDCGSNFTWNCFNNEAVYEHHLNFPWKLGELGTCSETFGGGCDGDCACDSGVFLGWQGAYGVYIFLFISIFFGWIVGQVIAHKQGGAMYKAQLDGIALTLVYWVGDPTKKWMKSNVPFSVSLGDVCLNVVSLIVPLAALTSEYAKNETKQYLEERVAFRIGMVSAVWARYGHQHVRVFISDPNDTVTSMLNETDARKELSVSGQHGASLNKRGPYMMLASPDENKEWLDGFTPKAQDIFDAGAMHVNRPRESQQFENLEAYCQATGENGRSVDKNQVHVTIYVRCKKPQMYDHMVHAVELGAMTCAKEIDAEPNVTRFGASDRAEVLKTLRVCVKSLDEFDVAERKQLDVFTSQLETKNIDSQFCAPFVEYVMAER